MKPENKDYIPFIEMYLNIEFEGDLSDAEQVNDFVNEYLDDAEMQYQELKCEYEAFLWE